MSIKHLSFDVWNTLITPNKEYGTHRTQAIARHFGVTEQEAKDAYKQCKKFLDNCAELVGFGMSLMNNWKLLEKTLGKKDTDLNAIISECDELFKAYQPAFDDELKEELKALKAKGFTLSIKSNTNFISGKTLSSVLFNDLDVFSFQHYSDMFGMAKPDFNFYALSSQELYNNHSTRDVGCGNIMHIGDNKITDGKCTGIGWNFGYVQGPEELLHKLKNNEIV